MNKKFLKNTSWIIFAKIFQMILGLFVSTWSARYLGPSNMGTISYVSSFITLFSAITTLGLNNVIIKELIEHKDSEGEVLGTAIVLRLASALVTSVMVLFLISILNDGDHLIIMITLLESIMLVAQSFEMLIYWYQSRLESKVTSIIQTIAYVAVSAYKLYGLVTQKDVIWFAFATSLETIVIAIMLLVSYKRNEGQKFGFKKVLAKEMLSISHHFIYLGIMVSIYNQMDSIMIKGWMNEWAVGQYSIATGINTMWSFIIQAIIDSAYPLIVELKKKENDEKYLLGVKKLYCIVFWISFIACVLITVFAKFIILTLYGIEYIPAIMTLRICTWSVIFSFLGVARNLWMICKNNQKYQKYILGIGCVVNLVLNSLLIPYYGYNGSALATLVTQIVTSYVAPLFFKATRKNTIVITEALNPMILFRK